MGEKNTFHRLNNPRVEKLVNEFFQRRIDGVQALDMRSAGDVFSDLVQVFDFHVRIPAFFGIKNDVGSFLACAEAHVGLYLDIVQTFRRDPLLELAP